MSIDNLPPGEGLRRIFEKQDRFLQLQRADQSRANHEQGSKVQFIYQSAASSTLSMEIANLSWSMIGVRDNPMGVNKLLTASCFVEVPDDTIVTSVRVYFSVAATWYYEAFTWDEWRYAKDMKMFYLPGYETGIYFAVNSDNSLQYFNPGTTNDITQQVFGSSSLNVPVTNPQAAGSLGTDPGVQLFEGVAGSSEYLTEVLNANQKVVFNMSTVDPDANVDFFSACLLQIVVNGYTRNR